MRRVARRDANEGAIVDALRDCGVAVERLSGPGMPDLLCRRGARAPVFLEVKAPVGPRGGGGGRLTEVQVKSLPVWGAHIVRDVGEALQAIGIVRTARYRP